MKAPSGSGPISHAPTFAAALALLFLAACATTRSAEEGSAPDPEAANVGYGITGDHVETVRDEDPGVVRSRTLAEMLARLPGVRVVELDGGGLSVRVRGSTSFLAGEEPLFVVDGMTVPPGALGSLNPNNIESITLLKNPGETAVYGSRGANGVILIKTKQGSR